MLLMVDIPPNRFFADVANRLDIVGLGSEGRQPCAETLELLAQDAGTVALERLDKGVWAIDRRGLDEQVNGGRPYFKGLNGDIDPGRLLEKKRPQSDLDRSGQDLGPVLGTPADRVAKIENSLITCCPAGMVHPTIIYGTGA